MTTAARDFNYALSLLGVMLFTTIDAVAALSGRVETSLDTNNSQFHPETSLEERLDLTYSDPEKGITSGLSLALFQRPGEKGSETYQLFIQQDFNNTLDQVSLGRFFRADTLGYYSLDGVQYRHRADTIIFNFYAGVPVRIEDFRSIDGDALYGLELQTLPHQINSYKVDARLGWQRLEQQGHQQRYHFGLRANSESENNKPLPSALSLSASYVEEGSQWESAQINTRWDLKNSSTLRLDYETYEPIEDQMSFRDRYYSLYARGRQTQFKASYQFKHDYQKTWSMAARQVSREFGGDGYAAMLALENRNNQGLRLTTKAEQLELQTERVSSLFIDAEKTLTASLRGGFSGVLQQQEKQLVGDNNSVGIEFRLEHMFSLKTLPSGLQFDVIANHIWNDRLEDEYRFLLRLGYKFGDVAKGTAQ